MTIKYHERFAGGEVTWRGGDIIGGGDVDGGGDVSWGNVKGGDIRGGWGAPEKKTQEVSKNVEEVEKKAPVEGWNVWMLLLDRIWSSLKQTWI